MSSSASAPQVLGRRTQFSILELGICASLAATAALGATLFALTQDPAGASADAARTGSSPAAVSSP